MCPLIAFSHKTRKTKLARKALHLSTGPTRRSHVTCRQLCRQTVSLFRCREGPWQRCWASANHKTLRRGAIIGAIQIMIVVFLFSFGGFLAAWSGLFVPSGPDDYGNTILFTLLSNQPGGVTPTARARLALLHSTGRPNALVRISRTCRGRPLCGKPP